MRIPDETQLNKIARFVTLRNGEKDIHIDMALMNCDSFFFVLSMLEEGAVWSEKDTIYSNQHTPANMHTAKEAFNGKDSSLKAEHRKMGITQR